jgi:tRNA pseudouridine55 synthase
VTIFALSVLEQCSERDYRLRVRCSKGTYIRTLCHDIGAALGCGGIMTELRRTSAAGFDLSQAVTMEEILNAPAPEALLLPVDAYFADYPEERISGEAERRCRNGNSFASDGPEGVFRVYGESGEFLMLGRRADATMSTVKSFFAPQTR